MPRITFDSLVNDQAEIIDALIVDVPDVEASAPVEPTAPAPRPDCMFCGQDYVIRPDTDSDDPTTMLITGCECSGCEALRALIPAVTDTEPVEIDPTPYLAPVTLTMHATMLGGFSTAVNGVACPDCTTAASVWSPRNCHYCGETLAPDAAVSASFARDGFGARLAARPGVLAGMEVGVAPIRSGRGNRRGRARAWYLRRPIMTDELSDRGEMQCVCQSCLDSAVACDCGALVTQGTEFFCDDCDSPALCNGCFTAEHQHREANTLEDARMSFRARATIESALAFSGVAGETITSTRALGIEVETARGDAAAVVRAEADAPVPVICQLGSDGSVRGRGAVEYRLLPQRGMWAEYAIRSMAQWCADAGYRPDSSAGIHMHVDVRDLIPAEVYQALAVLVSLDDVLFAHAATDRRHSTFCVPFPAAERAEVITRALAYARDGSSFTYRVTGDSRYRSVNTHAFSGHGTLEVRVFDSCHTPEAVSRFVDAGAIIAGAVDFARLDAFRDLLVAWPSLADADVTLARMAEAGCITHATALRAIARLRESSPASVAA